MVAQGQSFNYARAQTTALRLLEKFGQFGEIWRDVPGSGPVWDPGETTIQKTPCTLAVLRFDNRDIDGSLIKASDKKVYIAAKGLAIVPVTTDKLMIGGLSHSLVRVWPLNPAGTNVYFEVQARN
ncbi:hypothetical protein [Phyllobacterium endophyticum]|uniref:Head-tail adaptor protein n=1 Tax=Phyllobacterium endophyticum TaxID=1149773 RepID=A0A2P7AUT5_9HYPH|nr:hypothetical protein [Phyllobacterium endophyticum]MBB3234436.1 hypothetical protein [Phyllobacterium endophyticum]PSH57947.1 hypothetical protein CU100_09700 [Phyllobacterium endophyticum]TYR44155.1 hypothetical protein FY050_03050 [Phyllobacterium endophyticum]